MHRHAPAHLAVLALVLSSTQPRLSGQTAPPATPRHEVADTYFGTAVADPYRWMERPVPENPEFRRWLEAQNGYTRRVLDRIPGRAQLAERIRRLDDAGTSAGPVAVEGRRWFYLKTEPGVDNRKLYVRDGSAGAERLLVDPDALGPASGSHFSIDYLSPSPGGRLLAYGLSLGGSERSVLHLLDVASGRVLPDSITRAQFPVVSWADDGRSFFYNRLSAAGDTNPAERYRFSRAYRHVVGTPAEQDVEWLGGGTVAGVPVGPDDFPLIISTPGSKYLVAAVGHGVKNEVTLYTASRSAAQGASTPWRKAADTVDAVTSFAVHGDDLYLLTHKGAPRFKVIRTSAGTPNLARAAVVIPAGRAVIQAIGAARDALYAQELDGGLGRLARVPYNTGSPERLKLPFDGAVDFPVTDPARPGVVFRLQSWTRSPLWYAYDPGAREVRDTRLVPRSPVDFGGIESVETEARAGDGTMVPLSIVYRRDLRRDGSHPTLLEGYGAYGITFDPFFRPSLLAWLERGGVYAVAHVRGGGEYGEDWHQAGKGATKPNTWRDFIACAEFLVKEGYTSPAHLAGTGTSAGGILIGRAITERPDLFRAAVPQVGVVNALRVEHEPGGPANIPEFGTTTDSAGFRALMEMDALSHLEPGTRYPATMFTAGIFDSRVEPWQPAKMAAAMQAQATGERPVLLRVDFDAGHGMGLTKAQRSAQLADVYGFLFWQLGEPAFQLAP
ncbi:MAG TPA: prolyl oligopeptidase family serine peptidase [Gemmatimonadales bacterium]|nr:prolyl oligopeptidase family serine peptidase [Gemmatimonadales bacterium]